MTIEQQLYDHLAVSLNPSHFELTNDSHKHGNPPESGTHFSVFMVSDAFAGLTPVKRHQKVYGVCTDFLAGPVHALALHLYASSDNNIPQIAPVAPACGGGDGRL